MNHAAIVATYSDNALEGIIRSLAKTGEWPQRLRAASAEMRRRKKSNAAQDVISRK